jgi:hypothetical protein
VKIGARDVEDVRGDFPILQRQINGKPLAYQDNSATSQKPRQVLDAIRLYDERTNANVHRALDTFGDLAAFKGITGFPVRVKCATLAWHALLAQLPGS